MSNIISGCIYCGSTNYGKSCIFGPLNTHIITSEPNKCIYCGSGNLGSGCPWNPYGSVHVRSATFFNRKITESLILLKYFLEKTNSKDDGSNLDKFYKKLSEKINFSIEPLIHTFLVQEEIRPDSFECDYIKTIEAENQFKNLFEKFDILLEQVKEKFSSKDVEKILLNSIISQHEDQ